VSFLALLMCPMTDWKMKTNIMMTLSVTDMLTWAKSVLETEKAQRDTAEGETTAYPTSNPLRNITTTRGKAYWTRPNHDKFKNDIWYCLGWLRVVMPSSGLSCLGSNLRPRDDPISEKWIIGAEPPQVEVILHNGAALGSTCAFYTFPETQSGVVVFSNAMQSESGITIMCLAVLIFDRWLRCGHHGTNLDSGTTRIEAAC
jgi:CubicO group peptidase (beta-lactamase class C family)